MRIIFGFILAALSMSVQAASEPHCEVKATAKAEGKDKIAVEFRVHPNPQMAINPDGPWTLKLPKASGVTVATDANFKFDKDIPGFLASLEAVPQAKERSVDYELTAFICTADKKTCYRDVVKGQATLP